VEKESRRQKCKDALVLSLTNRNEHRGLDKGWHLKNAHVGIIEINWYQKSHGKIATMKREVFILK